MSQQENPPDSPSGPEATLEPREPPCGAVQPQPIQPAETEPYRFEIGKYIITGKLGEGGMGAVYSGQHKLLGRTAAIKVLLREHVEDEQLVERFINEARAATNINHPGIVDVYDFGHQDDGSVFIAMELLQGENLAQRMSRLGPMSPAQAGLFTQQICSALHSAHDRRVVHRDLKPSNLFVVPDPQVPGGERIKLLDFGIAKFATPGEAGSVTTKAGSMMGTPQYMSPEQCVDSSNVDHRADVYSIGCIFFEMLCGQSPFRGDTYIEVVSAQVQDQPPAPSSLQPDIPGQLDSILAKALAKDPGRRFQTARELGIAVQVALGHSFPAMDIPELGLLTGAQNEVTQAIDLPRSRGWLIALSAVIALIALAAAGWLFAAS